MSLLSLLRRVQERAETDIVEDGRRAPKRRPFFIDFILAIINSGFILKLFDISRRRYNIHGISLLSFLSTGNFYICTHAVSLSKLWNL